MATLDPNSIIRKTLITSHYLYYWEKALSVHPSLSRGCPDCSGHGSCSNDMGTSKICNCDPE